MKWLNITLQLVWKCFFLFFIFFHSFHFSRVSSSLCSEDKTRIIVINSLCCGYDTTFLHLTNFFTSIRENKNIAMFYKNFNELLCSGFLAVCSGSRPVIVIFFRIYWAYIIKQRELFHSKEMSASSRWPTLQSICRSTEFPEKIPKPSSII